MSAVCRQCKPLCASVLTLRECVCVTCKTDGSQVDLRTKAEGLCLCEVWALNMEPVLAQNYLAHTLPFLLASLPELAAHNSARACAIQTGLAAAQDGCFYAPVRGTA